MLLGSGFLFRCHCLASNACFLFYFCIFSLVYSHKFYFLFISFFVTVCLRCFHLRLILCICFFLIAVSMLPQYTVYGPVSLFDLGQILLLNLWLSSLCWLCIFSLHSPLLFLCAWTFELPPPPASGSCHHATPQS